MYFKSILIITTTDNLPSFEFNYESGSEWFLPNSAKDEEVFIQCNKFIQEPDEVLGSATSNISLCFE